MTVTYNYGTNDNLQYYLVPMEYVSYVYIPTLAIDPRGSLSACPHRQFHSLPGLLESRAAL